MVKDLRPERDAVHSNQKGGGHQQHSSHSSQIERLKLIYSLYDDVIANEPLACRRRCFDCCTLNVSVTQLEAEYLLSYVPIAEQTKFHKKLRGEMASPRFQPGSTLNRIAAELDFDLLAEGPPKDSLQTTCILLNGGLCSVYQARPFGCRCLISTKPCCETGTAEMDAFLLTVNYVFLQVIEHLDRARYSANLIDMLDLLLSSEIEPHSLGGNEEKQGVLSNHPLTRLLVPPAHRQRIQTLIGRINRLIADTDG